MVRVKRVYDAPKPDDGARFLVDRLWPRGLPRESLQLHDWLKDVAPSRTLRLWYGHDPDKWEEFCVRYFRELADKPQSWWPLVEAARQGDVTLLYAARDTRHNNAEALKKFIEPRLSSAPRAIADSDKPAATGSEEGRGE